MASNRIVVLGAGVSGLTTAYLLSKNGANDITVVAKHMPGDYDIEYCSPWAGANYLPVGMEGTPHAKYEKETWYALDELVKNHPDAGIHYQNTVIFNRERDANSATGQWFAELVKQKPWYSSVVPDFRPVPKDELAEGADSGSYFTSVCINTAVYLPWLVSQCLKNGVVFKRVVCKHISEAATAHHSGRKADLVVNCTGLSALKLGGVVDKTMYPARGQIIVVRNDPGIMSTISGCDDGDDEVCYIMTRAAGGGTILGGSYQKNNWDPNPDPNLSIRIMKRCIELCPELVGKDANGKTRGIEALSIIRQGVGLRPLRQDGIRIEKEKIDDTWVVHNYGHGGYGYQASYGCAFATVALVDEALKNKAPTAKL